MVFGDFAALPPEITSGRMYAGPGAESMLAAAAAWERLASELHSAASSYGSAISVLSNGWQGPSAARMASAAAPYVAWLLAAATQAQQAATQAGAAAGAYQAAFAATVPPPLIAANRAQLASLIATNAFGQNSAAIAAAEAQYGQMWAQDAAVMSGYAGASAAAAELTPFTEPPQTTDDRGPLAQAWDGFTKLPAGYTDGMRDTLDSISPGLSSQYETMYSAMSSIGRQAAYTNVVNASTSLGIGQTKIFYRAPVPAAIPKSSLGAGLAGQRSAAAGNAVAAVSVRAGEAPAVGALSVPQSWATATPAIRLAATALPNTGLVAAPAADFPAGLLGQGALGSVAGGALGGPAARALGPAGVAGRVIAGKNRRAPVKLDRVIAQLQQHPDTVQHWNVDQAGLDDLVAKLSTKPGIHAVHVCADGTSVPAGS